MIKTSGGILKLVVGFVIGGSVSAVVSNIVTATTPAATNKLHNTMVKIGGWALGVYVSDVVTEHIVDKVFNTTVSVNVEIKTEDVKEGKK